MGKRKRRKSAKLPLFDLPLNAREAELQRAENAEPVDSAEIVGDEDAEGVENTLEPSPSSGDRSAKGDLQLDLIEIDSSDAAAAGLADVGNSQGAVKGDDAALFGDRLLAGVADLAVQLVMSGAAVAASHAMGVTVTFADWMPFGILALVFSFLYWVVPLAFWGRTPGMAWVGHRAWAAKGGGPLTFGQTFLRWIGAIVTLAFLGLPLLLALTGRSLSDRVSDSETMIDP